MKCALWVFITLLGDTSNQWGTLCRSVQLSERKQQCNLAAGSENFQWINGCDPNFLLDFRGVF